MDYNSTLILDEKFQFVFFNQGSFYKMFPLLQGKGNVHTFWLTDTEQRRASNKPRRHKRARRGTLRSFIGSEEITKPSFITRSSSLRMSLKSSSKIPVTNKLPYLKLVTETEIEEEDGPYRKESTHSITSV